MSRNWIWMIAATALWTSSASAFDKQRKEKPNNPPSQPATPKPAPQPAAPKPQPQPTVPKLQPTPAPAQKTPSPQTPAPKPSVPQIQVPKPVTPQVPNAKPAAPDQPKQKPNFNPNLNSNDNPKQGNAKPNFGNGLKGDLVIPKGNGFGNGPGNPGKNPQQPGGGKSGQQPSQGNQRHDDDHRHHHGKADTNDLIRLFLFSNGGRNRPYGYGGYGYGPRNDPGFGRPIYVAPQYVIPVTPQQQFQPGIDAPPPPRLVVPTSEQFGSLAMPHQRELLLHAINSLDDDLTRIATGSQWKQHLQLAGLSEALTEVDGPLDATGRERFRKHAEVFDSVAQDPAYRSIAGLWGFGTLRVGLREFSEELVIQIRRAVAMNAGWLFKALDEVSTGTQWKTHLRLEMLMARDEPGISAAEALDRFDPVLAKFDRVQADPQYESVNELPGFQATHSALSDFVRELRLAIAPPAPAPDAPVPAPEPPSPKKVEPPAPTKEPTKEE